MKSYTRILIISALTLILSVGFARPALSAAAPADANAVTTPSLPYMAEITADDVYVRSGPGTNYYNCGKLNKGDKVKIVSRQFSWSCIVPPLGSFSWIYTPYVTIDPDNPGTGIVTGDQVRVYAGSDLVKPIHSTLQLKLDKGEKVKLLGEQKDNYYKIGPPTGAYLWVSTNFTVPSTDSTSPVVVVVEPNKPADVNAVVAVDVNVPPVVVVEPSAEAKRLAEYKELQKQILAERAKPVGKQDYSAISKALKEIAADKDAGKVARYCEYVLKQIERYELALAVSRELELQNKQFKTTQDRIKAARTTRLAQVKNLGRFAVVGTLKTSNIYSSEPQLKHYRIVGDSGKTVCYARPATDAVTTDYDKLVDKKVGLVGAISPHPATGGALIKFTEIIEIK
ncbi:MAG: SH3 domain-containing protein [Sedimentisphaerales bacterium]|nr:SH3 domain-containing protein [Sedimentisphaerales bacterium]